MASDQIENTLKDILKEAKEQNARINAMQTILVGMECGIYVLVLIEIGKFIYGFVSK